MYGARQFASEQATRARSLLVKAGRRERQLSLTLKVGFRSEPPIQVMGKRSVAQHQRSSESLVTAVPHTGAVRVSTGRRTQRPLCSSQRECAEQRPPSATAALPSLRPRHRLS